MPDLSRWTPRPTPGGVDLEGARVRVEPLDRARHGPDLFAAIGGAHREDLWRHMPVGPWPAPDDLFGFLADASAHHGWRPMAIVDRDSGSATGMAAYMHIREAHGAAEIGCVAFGPGLTRTTRATEALALMAGHVFALGYRRYEWKCSAANTASMRAAERFGFTFEGVFRNDMVMKEASRDTAWYSITDAEWPAREAALSAWLAGNNFATDGVQIRTLESFRRQT